MPLLPNAGPVEREETEQLVVECCGVLIPIWNSKGHNQFSLLSTGDRPSQGMHFETSLLRIDLEHQYL